MEEKITQRSINTLNITIIANRDSSMADEISAFIAPDGKEARELTFSIMRPAMASADKLYENHLVLFLENKDTEPNAGLLRTLERKNINYIRVMAPEEEAVTKIKETILSLEKALDSGFTIQDFMQIYNMGIPMETIRRHLTIFRNGISKVELEKPAVLNDGIYPLQRTAAEEYAKAFENRKHNFKLKKFVPASGAASRMFKFLCEFIAEFNPDNESINAYINRKNASALSVFLVGLDKFPFFKDILQVTKENPEYAEWNKNQRYHNFIRTLLAKDKFDYANKPKGILPFHQYEDFIATPVYEHLKEAVAYASSNGEADVHFTISEEHLDGFLDAIKEVKPSIEEESGIKINFSFSYQHKETDTIAVDLNNLPFRDGSGRLVFRPGGHGALIENLNRLDDDIVFIKNIDNVSHNNIKTIALYKKALAGMLMELQEQIFNYLKKIDSGSVTDTDLREIILFAKEKLSVDIPQDVSKYTPEHKIEYVRDLLDRPIRICGMVKNEGEPGGGPFWIKGDKGRLTLQIIESSQIDLDNKEQQKILAASTHFNPVDVVCGLKNYKGERFDLCKFVDPSTGFIVYKNKNGKDVKSYELPGLWNGAMAGWITVFVEEPLETFNPVKTVNDLLKPAHQPQ
jgi:hypothetical protein